MNKAQELLNELNECDDNIVIKKEVTIWIPKDVNPEDAEEYIEQVTGKD